MLKQTEILAKIKALKTSRLFKNGVIALTLVAATSGAGAAYAESNLYRQHKAQALHANKISAAQAVDLALKQVSGKAVSVDFEHKLGDVGTVSGMAGKRYEVDIISANGEKHEVGIDADTGSVVYNKTKTNKRKNATQPANPTISLQQAMQTATAQNQGVVKDAELDNDNGTLRYEVKIVQQDGSKQKVYIDANTGAVFTPTPEQDD